MSRILKWKVPIDDEWHRIGAGPVVLVGPAPSVDADELLSAYVWTEEPDEDETTTHRLPREARVYGTGHSFDGWTTGHLGSYVAAPFVWHVRGRGLSEEVTAP